MHNLEAFPALAWRTPASSTDSSLEGQGLRRDSCEIGARDEWVLWRKRTGGREGIWCGVFVSLASNDTENKTGKEGRGLKEGDF